MVRIYQKEDLESSPPVNNPVLLDVATNLFPSAVALTGAAVARLHGIFPSPDQSVMALNFVASGHLGIVEAESRKALCLFRTTGTTTGRQNHMSFWSPTGEQLIVANQNGRMLERINVLRDSSGNMNAFVFDAAASLDMVGGSGRIVTQPVAVDLDPADDVSCTVSGVVQDGQSLATPNGVMKQFVDRPTNTVICPLYSSTGMHVFATLGGGGMFVVDATSTPLKIVAEYGKSVIRAAGCGGTSAAGFMHLNTGTPGADISEFSIYRITESFPFAPAFNAPNFPAPESVWQDVDNGKVAGIDLPHDMNRDAHGMMLASPGTSSSADYLHQFDRIRNNVEVFKIAPPWHDLGKRHIGSYDLTISGACGTTLGSVHHNDPTPDLGDLVINSSGRSYIYVALRGPFPLTVAHAASGSCPGLGIVELSSNLKSGTLVSVLPTFVADFAVSKNLSDPHAVVVRYK
jgi:hypothetical protein